jgi:hypothetical protein
LKSLGAGSVKVSLFSQDDEEDVAVRLQEKGKLKGKLEIKGVWTFG